MTKQHQLEHIEFKILSLPKQDQLDIERMRFLVAADPVAWAGLRQRGALAYLSLAIQMEELIAGSAAEAF